MTNFLKNSLVIFILLFHFHWGLSQPHLDSTFVWNGVELGKIFENLDEFTFKNSYQKLDKYVKKQKEITNFEGIALKSVYYYFFQKRLHSIVIKTAESEEASELLLNWLTIMFGEGEQDGFSPRYRWKGKKISVVYDKNIITKQTELKIQDNATHQYFDQTVNKIAK